MYQQGKSQSLTLSLIGIVLGVFGLILIVPGVICSKCYPTHVTELIGSTLFFISMSFWVCARNRPHRGKYKAYSSTTAKSRFISVGTCLVLLQLMGVGTFVGKGLIHSNLGGQFKSSVSSGWLFTAMLATATFASLVLFIKDTYKNFEDIKACISSPKHNNAS